MTPALQSFRKWCNADLREFLQGILLEIGVTIKARILGQAHDAPVRMDDDADSAAARNNPCREARQIEQFDVMADDHFPAFRRGPAHRGRNARLLGGEENIGCGPGDLVFARQGHCPFEPGPCAGVVFDFLHLDLDQRMLPVPTEPIGFATPMIGVTQAVDPGAVVIEKQQDFTPRVVGQQCRTDFRMVGDNGEQVVIETRQIVDRQLALHAPALAGPDGGFDRTEQLLHLGFKLAAGLRHLRIRQRRH